MKRVTNELWNNLCDLGLANMCTSRAGVKVCRKLECPRPIQSIIGHQGQGLLSPNESAARRNTGNNLIRVPIVDNCNPRDKFTQFAHWNARSI